MGFAGRVRQAAFRFRSFTPIPFLILAVAFARPVFWGLVTGFFMICIGELLRFWAVSVAGGETRTTRIPHGRGDLVTDGPFAYLRNPMYVGNLIIYSGVGHHVDGHFSLAPPCRVALLYHSVRSDYHVRRGFLEGSFWTGIRRICREG